jgi:AraC-like DNA-binding protein
MAPDRNENSLPMVRAMVLGPVIQALETYDYDIEAFLEPFQLSPGSLEDPKTYIHNDLVYRVFSAAAELRQDPSFCVSVGREIDLSQVLPFGDSLKEALTIGDYFSRFTQAVASDTTSISQRLIVEDNVAYFSAKRMFEPSDTPAQSDGYMVGIWVTFLHKALDFRWDPSVVIVQMCDPMVLPEEFHGIRAIKSNNRGFSIKFPAAWLSYPLNSELAPVEEGDPQGPELDMLAPIGFMEAVKTILGKHIGDKDLSVPHAAELCGYSKSALTRRLVKFDTTIIDVLTDLRMEAAESKLAQTTISIRNIALSLAYSDATAFSRAFRKRTGASPSTYRKSMKNLEKPEC